MIAHYYNEFNPESAAMLRQQIKDGLLPDGEVDERSIVDVVADELRGFTQCHFFAGIGGWSYALQLAGWSNERPVWTGSCPCQPFSSAGRQGGKGDVRHLWPVWERLIAERLPAVCFGEQVGSAVAHGWLDDVYQGLEAQGYAVGSAILPACSVGAPHKRDRLWFVGESYVSRSQPRQQTTATVGQGNSSDTTGGDVAHAESKGSSSERSGAIQRQFASEDCSALANAQIAERERCGNSRTGRDGLAGYGGFWDEGQWIDCPDGKQRLVEPSICLLAHGFQHRRPLLHAGGNAIVPQVAAQFIGAFMDTEKGETK